MSVEVTAGEHGLKISSRKIFFEMIFEIFRKVFPARMVSKKVSAASISIAVLMPLSVGLLGSDLKELLAAVSLSVLILVRHRANFKRLLSGSEHSLGTGG